jgi:hypothetical protein
VKNLWESKGGTIPIIEPSIDNGGARCVTLIRTLRLQPCCVMYCKWSNIILDPKPFFSIIDHDKIGIKCNKVMTMKIQALLEFGVFSCVNVKG